MKLDTFIKKVMHDSAFDTLEESDLRKLVSEYLEPKTNKFKQFLKYAYFLSIAVVIGFLAYNLISAEKVSAKNQGAISEQLKDFNEIKLQDLITTEFWGHPNSDGCDYKCRISGNFELGERVSENLYKGPCDMLTAFEAWKASPKHLEVMQTEFDQVLMQGKVDAEGKCYIVLNISSLN